MQVMHSSILFGQSGIFLTIVFAVIATSGSCLLFLAIDFPLLPRPFALF
jgi:hypothetical protein